MEKKLKPQPETLSVSLLGGIVLEKNGVTLTDQVNRSLKLWNVLAYLIVHRGRSVSQAELIENFWPGDNSANPINALKTLLHRIRVILADSFGEGFNPIVAQRGSYVWNSDIACVVDIDRFDELCRAAEDEAQLKRRMEIYRQALALYKGDFLPKLGDQMWVLPLATHYHNLYLHAVHEFSALLEQQRCSEEAAAVCIRASKIDPLDEKLHVTIVRALLQQGQTAAALSHYEAATDMLYRGLGVHPSKELRALYTDIMAESKSLETDLHVIQSDLEETASQSGAFYCEYGFFREIYRLEARRILRSGLAIHIALLTVSMPGGEVPPLDVLNTTMAQLKDVALGNLRRGDVVCRYSGAQYVIMLPSASLEDSEVVVRRIIRAFYKQHRKTFLKITSRVRALEVGS